MNTNSTQQEMPVTPDLTAPPQPEMTSPVQPVMQAPVQEPVKQGVSEDTKTLVTVLLLIFAFPIGLIVMFFWPKWKWWVKLLVVLPGLLLTFILLAAMLVAVNPKEQIERAECVTSCQESGGTDCAEMCAMPAPADTTDSVNSVDSETQMPEVNE